MNGLFKRAVESRQRLEMIYISKEGVISQRDIKVLAVSDVSINWGCHSPNFLVSQHCSTV